MSVYKIILLYFNSLTGKTKIFTWLVILLIFLSALFETIASVLIFPYIMVISNNITYSNNQIFAKLNEIILISSRSEMILYFSIFLLFIFAAKSLFSLFVQRLQFNFISDLLKMKYFNFRSCTMQQMFMLIAKFSIILAGSYLSSLHHLHYNPKEYYCFI